MPVIQSGKSLVVTTGYAAHQRRVVALLGTQPHGRSRSGAPMLSLSQQLTSSVPIKPNELSENICCSGTRCRFGRLLLVG